MCDEHRSILEQALEHWRSWEARARELERKLTHQTEFYTQRACAMASEIERLREMVRSLGGNV